ncbi:pimeloyl-ACP methyl ester esterase BioH [Oceanisphaera avium]|uniref:Pimeloyl-[acyl-carrier protein] methyl ester esterase n=1 Tax=Oceanisphaera avium TaxID=1903694 RepID=A0A1Y0CZ31_9GAMM|nr:pimeloyl-ACP methyl ester esterase BioH [Oceanisphaera avium]ART80591.1 pimeloyl-[acyl-carrier protein] methyl ester esterase [Oceanisphaera avium]
MSVYVECHGQGADLVLVHGWGMNGAVWEPLVAQLSCHFRLHIVDLPGFGDSAALPLNASLDEWASAVLNVVPEHAAWLGWSLGGLVATQAALQAPNRVSHLLTLASSPCFVAREQWPGIKPHVLASFAEQLAQDSQLVIKRFLALQAMGSEHAKADVRQLRTSLATKPQPQAQALVGGLNLLAEVDLRAHLFNLTMPCLRLYGHLDALVPYQAIPLIEALMAPNNRQHCIAQRASHAPFISHPQLIAAEVSAFLRSV